MFIQVHLWPKYCTVLKKTRILTMHQTRYACGIKITLYSQFNAMKICLCNTLLCMIYNPLQKYGKIRIKSFPSSDTVTHDVTEFLKEHCYFDDDKRPTTVYVTGVQSGKLEERCREMFETMSVEIMTTLHTHHGPVLNSFWKTHSNFIVLYCKGTSIFLSP